MPRYEFVEGTSNKFWEIKLEGSAFQTKYGRIGTPGAVTLKEFDSPEKWGGEIKLGNGGVYYIEPQAAPARLPYSVRAKRLDGVE